MKNLVSSIFLFALSQNVFANPQKDQLEVTCLDQKIELGGSIFTVNATSAEFSWKFDSHLSKYDSLVIQTIDDAGVKLQKGKLNEGKFTVEKGKKNKPQTIKFFLFEGKKKGLEESFILNFGKQKTENNGKNEDGVSNLTKAMYDYFVKNYKDKIVNTDLGYKLNDDDRYIIHIFFDQYGNSLYSSIPTGISRKYHYKIHIIHQNKFPGIDDFIFSVNKTSGKLSDVPVYYNADKVADLNVFNSNSGSIDKNSIVITETPFELFPSSNDLSFEIKRTFIKDDSVDVKVLNTYTIEMTPMYNGSFSVGLIHSNLSNPTFELVNSPTTTGAQTVKTIDDSKNVFITVMYTAYWSPVKALQNIGNKQRRYSNYGRSYLDDDNDGLFLTKIYPCVGVSLSDRLMTNWFAGFNYEPFQGLGVFLGANIRKVNTFDLDGYVDGQTVTQDQFDYYTNTKLKAKLAIGVEIDITAFLKMLGGFSGK